jgi:hypothetical protein
MKMKDMRHPSMSRAKALINGHNPQIALGDRSKSPAIDRAVVFFASHKRRKNIDLRHEKALVCLLRCKTFAIRLPSLTLERELQFAAKLTITLQPA